MSTDLDRDRAGQEPLRSPEELAGWFDVGSKPRERWGVGLEYERLGVFTDSGKAIPYHGENGSLRAILEELTSRHGWTAWREEGRPIALSRADTWLTLEPGSQAEMSSRVHVDLREMRDELCAFVSTLSQVSAGHGISWLGLGVQPFTDRDDIPWVPKTRYRLMSSHLEKAGSLGLDMMKRTAGIQVNLDYADEADAGAKFRTLMAISPLITALFANSPLENGRSTGFMSRRAEIWRDTDKARCGLLRFALEDRPLFSSYLEYALDVPMMFVMRDGGWCKVDVPFRTFIRDGYQGLTARLADWELHITTLFPDVRLKRFIEARCADSTDASLAMAQAALIKGILYDAEALGRAWELVSDLTWEDFQGLHQDVPRVGLHAMAGRRPALDLSRDLVDLAREGLRRVSAAQGLPVDSEAEFLAPLEIILRDGESPARRLLRLWETSLDRDPARLVTHLAQINLDCYSCT
jgi:glutamate--cysteine ligase